MTTGADTTPSPAADPTALHLAVIGDIHERWSDEDRRAFNASDYDALLFVGDLPTHRLGRVYAIARALAGLTKPAYLIPGNHDGTTLPQLAAEVLGVRRSLPGSGRAMHRRVDRLERALGPVTLCGYDWHLLAKGDLRVGLVCGRPHSMGGRLNFAPYLDRRFGVRSLSDSVARLRRVVDDCPYERLIVLAHNGPAGLGDRAADIWGCDFRRQQGDWGDPDLRAMIDHANASGRRIAAVVAGHMHHRTTRGDQRPWRVARAGIDYINAARVPRIVGQGDRRQRHHIALTVGRAHCTVREVLWP